jgi:hypothetical protein
MLRDRDSPVRRILFCGIGIVCLCVVMYMLGSTMTLWTLEFAFDQTDSPLLEGVSLPTILPDLNPAMPVTTAAEQSPPAKLQLHEHGLLRPPNTTA